MTLLGRTERAYQHFLLIRGQCIASSSLGPRSLIPQAPYTKNHSTRTMPRFFVYAPDYPDSVDRRYAVREAHLEAVKPAIEKGIMRVGGMIVDPEKPTIELPDGEVRKNATGSVMIVECETIEDAKRVIHNDIYWTSGVWDKEKTVIQEFFAGTPFP